MHSIRYLLLGFAMMVRCAYADILFSEDQNLEGFGEENALIFSAAFTIPNGYNLDAVSIDVTHNYAAELEFSLTSPDAQVFHLLQRNGFRSRVGDGSGTLAGVETYTLVESGAPLGSVADSWWGSNIPGGTYDALEWPSGLLAEGSWTIALRNVDLSSLEGGALGNVSVSGHLVPEPNSFALSLVGLAAIVVKGRTKRCTE